MLDVFRGHNVHSHPSSGRRVSMNAALGNWFARDAGKGVYVSMTYNKTHAQCHLVTLHTRPFKVSNLFTWSRR